MTAASRPLFASTGPCRGTHAKPSSYARYGRAQIEARRRAGRGRARGVHFGPRYSGELRGETVREARRHLEWGPWKGSHGTRVGGENECALRRVGRRRTKRTHAGGTPAARKRGRPSALASGCELRRVVAGKACDCEESGPREGPIRRRADEHVDREEVCRFCSTIPIGPGSGERSVPRRGREREGAPLRPAPVGVERRLPRGRSAFKSSVRATTARTSISFFGACCTGYAHAPAIMRVERGSPSRRGEPLQSSKGRHVGDCCQARRG